MTDPTSYAAGIEAAARVADAHTHSPLAFNDSIAKAIATAIRSLAPERGGGSGDVWRSNYQNAWSALQMIRETVEAVCPAGALPSQEAVLGTRGPEPVHEAEAICEAIATLSAAPPSGWRKYQDAIATTDADIAEAWRIIGQVSSDHLLNSTEGHVAVRKGIQYGRAAAPPPPVPAQAESGEQEQARQKLHWMSLAAKSMAEAEQQRDRIRELEGALEQAMGFHPDTAKENLLALTEAQNRISELEGEVAQYRQVPSMEWEGFAAAMKAAEARADRLTTAAQAARDALESLTADIRDYEKVNNLCPSPGKPDCWQSMTRAREALAALASVLDGGEG